MNIGGGEGYTYFVISSAYTTRGGGGLGPVTTHGAEMSHHYRRVVVVFVTIIHEWWMEVLKKTILYARVINPVLFSYSFTINKSTLYTVRAMINVARVFEQGSVKIVVHTALTFVRIHTHH